MLVVENMAALVAFALCVSAFAAGYLLRRWVDMARAEWADAFAYRQGRADDGRR